MVTEKGFALAEALVTLFGGGSMQKVVRRYRGHVRTNKRRLSRPGGAKGSAGREFRNHPADEPATLSYGSSDPSGRTGPGEGAGPCARTLSKFI